VTIGFPSIPDPRVDPQGALDARGVQGIVRNIRERIQAAEALLAAVQLQANQTSFSVGSLQSINRALAQLAARVTVLESLVHGSQTVTLVAGAAIALDDPVVMSSPTACVPVDVSDPERIYAVVGIATQAASTGASVLVQVFGAYNLSYGNFEAGHALYCDLDGLTETPSYGIVAIPMGVATGSQSMWISPGYPRLQNPSQYDLSEQFLPVTYGLFQSLVPLPENPSGVIGFTPVDGVLDGFFMRADAAPALGTTLVVPGLDDFSLSTASDAGTTDNRGDIAFTGGANDTYTGATVQIAGAYATFAGDIYAAGGDSVGFTGATLNIGGATSTAGGGLSMSSGVNVECTAEVDISFTATTGNVTLTGGGGGVFSLNSGFATVLGPLGVGLHLSDEAAGAAEFPGQLAMWSSDFGSPADARLGVVHAIASTTDATPTEVETTAGNFIVLTDDSSYIFDCQIVARNTGDDDETAAFSLIGVIRRGSAAANTVVVGTPTLTILAQDTGTTTWTCDFTADTTNGRPTISVTGEAAKTIRWVANMRMTKVMG
jgi:hypothetical protein